MGLDQVASQVTGQPEIGSRSARSRIPDFEYRNETLVGIVVFATIWLAFPHSTPAGVYGEGVVSGAGIALQAIGFILVYRTNRIINFSQVAVGSTMATLFSLSATYAPAIRWARHVCAPCVGQTSPRWMFVTNYWLSALACVLGSAGLSWIIYHLTARRFANRPRLLFTVATIFVAEGLPSLSGTLTGYLTTNGERKAGILASYQAPPPENFTVGFLHPAEFRLPDVLTVLVAAVAAIGLSVYLRRSATGTAIRAAAENPDRAGTLGVNVAQVSSRVWLISGGLSGFSALFASMSIGGTQSQGIISTVLVEILAVAVVARLSSLPVVTIAAITLGILYQAMLWSFHSTAPLEGSFVILISVVLLLQRNRVTRADVELASSFQESPEARPTPPELRALPVVRRAYRAGAFLLAITVFGFPWVTSPSQIDVGTAILVDAMVGLSLLILTGWAGQISLGQFAFAAVGGYIAAVSRLPFVLAVGLGAVAGAVVATLVGLPALRLRGLHLAITSVAFATSVGAFLLNPTYLGKYLPSSLRRPRLLGLDLADGKVYYYVTLLALVVILVGILGLRRSRTARALLAGRDNDRSAQSFGISLARTRLSAFAIAGFIAALGGAMFAYQQNNVSARDFSADQSAIIFLMVVIGGLGSAAGPLIGAFYLAVLQLGGTSPLIESLLIGWAPFVLLLLVPGGLGQVVFDVRDAMLRRVASRNRIDVPSLTADRRRGADDGRVQVAPKTRSGGRAVFVPARYRLGGQWALGVVDAIVQPGALAAEVGKQATSGTFEGVQASENETAGARG